MPDRAAKDKRLGDIFHFDGRLHARFDAHVVERLRSASALMTVANIPM